MTKPRSGGAPGPRAGVRCPWLGVAGVSEALEIRVGGRSVMDGRPGTRSGAALVARRLRRRRAGPSSRGLRSGLGWPGVVRAELLEAVVFGVFPRERIGAVARALGPLA